MLPSDLFYEPVTFEHILPEAIYQKLQAEGLLEPLAQEILEKLKAMQPTYSVQVDAESSSIAVIVNVTMAQDLIDELVICLHGDEEWEHEWETLLQAKWIAPDPEDD